MLHRDIKPSNLLLDRNGDVRLADFGLARSLDDDGSLTITGEFLGTLRYAAPETLRGRFDHRSDIYSLGVTLFELVIRLPAFVGASREALLECILRGAPQAWPEDVSCHRDLRTIIRKAMSPEPAERYATAAALADDLDRFCQGRPVLARRPTAWDHLRGWCRRQPLLAGLVASLGLSLTGGLATATWLWRDAVEARERMSQERSRAIDSESIATGQRIKAERAAHDATMTVAELHHQTAIRQLELRNDDHALIAVLESLRLAAQTPPLEVQGTMANGVPPVPDANVQPPDLAAERLSLAESNRLLASSLEWRLPVPIARTSIADRVDSWELLNPAVNIGRDLPALRFDPDGQRLLVGSQIGSDFRRWDLASDSMRPLLGIETLPGVPITYCRDLRHAVLQRPDRTLELWDVAAGSSIALLEVTARNTSTIRPLAAWMSPDARRLLLFAYSRGTGPSCWLYDVATGRIVGDRRLVTHAVSQAWFSPDARYLYTSGEVGQLWDTETLLPVRGAVPGHVQPSFTLRELLLGFPDQVQVWELASITDEAPSRVIQLPEGARLSTFVYDPKFGRTLIGTRSGEILVFSLADDRLERRMQHGSSPITHLAPSTDGHHLMSADTSRRVMTWDLILGELAGPALEHSEEITSVAWSDDSRRFATATALGELTVWQRPAEPRTVADDVALAELAPNGEDLLIVHRDGRLTIRNLASDRVLHRHESPMGSIKIAAWGAASDRIALAAGDKDAETLIWDLSAGDQPPFSLQRSLPFRDFGQLLFSGQTNRLVSYFRPLLEVYDTDRAIAGRRDPSPARPESKLLELLPGPTPQKLHLLTDRQRVIGCLSPSLANHDLALGCWDMLTGEVLHKSALPPGRSTNQLALSHDGGTLLAVGDYGLLAWDTSDWSQLPLPQEVWKQDLIRILPHPTLPLAATIGRDHVIRCLDYRSGEPLGQPVQGPSEVLSFAWSADGRLLQSISATYGLQWWDWRRGEPLSPPIPIGSQVQAAIFSPKLNRWLIRSADEAGSLTQLDPPLPSDRPIEAWIDRASFLTGYRIDPENGRAHRITIDQWRSLRDRTAAPGEPSPLPSGPPGS